METSNSDEIKGNGMNVSYFRSSGSGSSGFGGGSSSGSGGSSSSGSSGGSSSGSSGSSSSGSSGSSSSSSSGKVKLSSSSNKRKRIRYVKKKGFRLKKASKSEAEEGSESAAIQFKDLDDGRKEISVDNVKMCHKAEGEEKVDNCENGKKNVNDDGGWGVKDVDKGIVLTSKEENEDVCLTKEKGGKLNVDSCRELGFQDQRFDMSDYAAGGAGDGETWEEFEELERIEEEYGDSSATEEENNKNAEEKKRQRQGREQAKKQAQNQGQGQGQGQGADQNQNYYSPYNYGTGDPYNQGSANNSNQVSSSADSGYLPPDSITEPRNLNSQQKQTFDQLKSTMKKANDLMKDFLKHPHDANGDKLLKELTPAISNAGNYSRPGCRFEIVQRCD